MPRAQLDDFLAGVQALVDGGDGADVVALGEALVNDATPEVLASARAELESAVRILDRRAEDVADLVELGERFTARLLGTVRGEAQRDAREYSYSLGERILHELHDGPSAPTELADRLDVELSQISRASRALQDDGRLVVERDAGDGRRRVYRAAAVGAGARNRRRWQVFIERLPTLRASDIVSDMLPHRVGDDLNRAAMAQVCGAFGADVASGRYQPTQSHEIDIPKPAGGQRPAAALRFADRLAYAALVERCRSEIEASLVSDRAVLWPRGKQSEKQWVKFEGFVANSGTTHVLSVDVQSFYDSIRHDLLHESLTRAGCDSQAVAALTEWLGEVMGRRSGLPQGLGASDPLASAVLSPLDRALVREGMRFVRHGDDLRVVGTYAELSDTQRLVRDELRELGLVMNDDKTRVLRRDTYVERRSEIASGVQEYLTADDRHARDSAIYRLLSAFEADDELSWSWYHGSLGVSEALDLAGPGFEPSDADALTILLSEAASSEEATIALQQTIHRHRSAETTLLVQACISLLATAEPAVPAIDVEASLVARPEYADVLSSYVEQIAPRHPAQVARLLQQIEATGVTYDAQWLRLYRALDDVKSGDFDDLAAIHLDSPNQSWIRRLQAARFMARRARLDSSHLTELYEHAPAALRDDVLEVVATSAPTSVSPLLTSEGAVVAALLDVAA